MYLAYVLCIIFKGEQGKMGLFLLLYQVVQVQVFYDSVVFICLFFNFSSVQY